MAGYVAISGILTGTPTGTQLIGPNTISGNSSNDYQTTAVTLSSGANTITIPSWAAGVIIQPNTSNAVALTLKGVTGDTGIAISSTAPTLLSFAASPPSTFVITAASTLSYTTQITFF